MKVGIITILKVNNYGAELQAYATQAILNKMGYDAEIIDYLFYKNPSHIKESFSKPSFPYPLSVKVKEYIYPILAQLKTLSCRKHDKIRKKRFESFHREHTVMSRTFRSMSDLYKAKLDYDVYITGSDQVWNPYLFSSLEPYFLTFAPEGKRRISYASSFGVSEIPSYAKEYYNNKLKRYDAIGVREQNAVGLISSIAKKNATWVLDPTLLLKNTDWRAIEKKTDLVFDKEYILIYELTPCSYILELAKYYSKNKNWQIVRICKNAHNEDNDKDIINVIDAGPAEFLYLFDNASFIITNSFHGSAFAINFFKDFYTVLPLKKSNNSRQKSLLNLFDLSSRLIVEGDPIPNLNTLSIDYIVVKQKLEEERIKSVKFLKTSIDGQ